MEWTVLQKKIHRCLLKRDNFNIWHFLSTERWMPNSGNRSFKCMQGDVEKKDPQKLLSWNSLNSQKNISKWMKDTFSFHSPSQLFGCEVTFSLAAMHSLDQCPSDDSQHIERHAYIYRYKYTWTACAHKHILCVPVLTCMCNYLHRVHTVINQLAL